MAELDLTVGPRPAPEIAALPSPPPSDDLGQGDELPLDGIPLVDEKTVRSLLAGASGVVGFVAGLPEVPGHWRFTPEELDGLVPPLTRLANRNPVLRRALIQGDILAVVLSMTQYGMRNVRSHKEAVRARQDVTREAHLAAQFPGSGAPESNGYGGRPAGADDGRGDPGAPGVRGGW